MRIDAVIVKNLPSKPGIYIFKNKNSETLYVGKAKNLQKRISSYFSKSRDSRLNIEFLMREAWDIDFTSTNSEEEALMLESKTIKIRQPKYNILLKDDKTYASLRIELNREFPRISSSRKCDDSNSIYLGPFKSSDGLRKTKKLFQKIFGIRDCSESKFKLHRKRACVYKNIDLDIYQLVSQFYSKKTSIPEKIILAQDFPCILELKKDLKDFTFSKNKIEVSIKKNSNHLIKLANDNAEGYIVQNIKEEEEVKLSLNKIKLALNLKKLPNKIECFDISNTQGTNPVASMVTFVNGVPDKSQYKKFKINTKGPNDYAMMLEAVDRRLKRINDKGWEPPDLILLDGGKGHLNKIAKLDLNNIDIASIAKPRKNEKNDKIYTINQSKPADFSGNIKALNILINARNEAHRFALTFHRDRRKKAMLQSNLKENPI